MIIAITAQGEIPAAILDARFGRAPFFMLWDTEREQWRSFSNQQNFDAEQGAGIQAAQQVIDAQANVVITGHCGPKAFRLLQAAGVKVYIGTAGTVEAVLAAFEAKTLTPLAQSDVEGHWA